MDLLEIRKKAKGLKAEEEEAARKAASGAGVPGEAEPDAGAAAEGLSGEPVPKPKAKKPGTRRKKAKPPEPASEPGLALGEAAASGDEEPSPEPESEPEAVEETPGAPEPPVVEEHPAVVSPPPAVNEDGREDGEESGDAVVEYLAFRLGSEEYAVKVEDVREIIRVQKITDVPRAPGFVKGIISLRGVIIPIFDIKNRLGFEDAENTRSTRIVVVSEDGMPQGVIVDKVTGVVRFPMKTIEPPPAVIGGVEAEYIQGVGRMGDRLLILLNTGRILAMEG